MKTNHRGLIILLILSLLSLAIDVQAEPRAAILNDPTCGIDSAFSKAVAEALQRSGVVSDLLSNPTELDAKKYFLCVIPNAASYPEAGVDALTNYLRAKGSLFVIGTDPFASLKENPPLIETLSPAYKTYPLKDIASLNIVSAQGILSGRDAKLPVPGPLYSCFARPEGKGFERGYQWRWIPLVRACDKDGVDRGAVIWMMANQTPLSEGPEFANAVRCLVGNNKAKERIAGESSVCAVCAITDPSTLMKLASTSVFGDIAKRIRDGVFLSRAGAHQFSYWPGEKVQLGAVVENYGRTKVAVSARVRVCPQNSTKAVFHGDAKLSVEPGKSGTVDFEWAPKQFYTDKYVVTTELLRDGKIIDVISHEIGVLSTRQVARDEFVTVRNGDFWLKGKKWYPMGVNYWPRYSIALEHEDYVYHWLTPGFYNPEEVERDLRQLESIGSNFVCIRAHHQNDRRTLLSAPLREPRDTCVPLRANARHRGCPSLFPGDHDAVSFPRAAFG